MNKSEIIARLNRIDDVETREFFADLFADIIETHLSKTPSEEIVNQVESLKADLVKVAEERDNEYLKCKSLKSFYENRLAKIHKLSEEGLI